MTKQSNPPDQIPGSRYLRSNTVLTSLIIGLVILAVTMPYIAAFGSSGSETLFVGFLLNPIDGNTYLAKMYQGWEGSWLYRLAYTPDPGEGAFFSTIYLLLGHLARLAGLPLIGVFHAARVLAALFMLVSLRRFFGVILPGHLAVWGFTLAAIGSGLGWLAVPFGGFTSDLWVAEAYPFLAAYTNPHFPFSLGLMTWILTPRTDNGGRERAALLIGFLLAWILPFGLIIALGVFGGIILLNFRAGTVPQWVYKRFFWMSLAGGPVILYELWVVQTNPAFAGWNAQNITTTPPPWDLLISFSPAVLLAVSSAWSRIRNKKNSPGVLVLWFGVVLLLIYLPLGLQRRLLTGFYIPLAALSVLALDRLAKGDRRRTFILIGLLIVLSLPTNLIVLLAARHGAQTRDPALYLTSDEAEAVEWIVEYTHPDAIFLASPEIGLLIPGLTGRQVVYGHPFETVDAPAAEAKVISFYEGDWEVEEAQSILSIAEITYVFFGPRERELGRFAPFSGLEPVFQLGEVAIYEVDPLILAGNK